MKIISCPEKEKFKGRQKEDFEDNPLPWIITMLISFTLTVLSFFVFEDHMTWKGIILNLLVFAPQVVTLFNVIYHSIKMKKEKRLLEKIQEKLLISGLPEEVDLGKYFQQREEAINNCKDLSYLKKTYLRNQKQE